jgi:hypothetical protein
VSSTYVAGNGSALPADPFATVTGLQQAGYVPTVEAPRFGQVRGNGRYHMPLLPGEDGPKGGGEYVPHGLMRVTNLAAAISDSEALNVWEQEQALIGVAKDASLYEELCLAVHRAEREGVNLQRLDLYPELRRALTGTWKDRDNSLAGRAKAVAGANKARQAGINRHEAWEYRAQTGELIGTPDIQAQLEALEALLEAAHLERVPGLCERVVRNTEVNCAGRFDDVLRDRRTGELFMADLKNKSRKFWTWLEVDIQLSVYARAQYMLATDDPHDADRHDEWYVDGPALHVDQEVGVVLVMPSDGGAPYLRKADLVRGWSNALLARRIVEERSYGKGKERERWGVWEVSSSGQVE